MASTNKEFQIKLEAKDKELEDYKKKDRELEDYKKKNKELEDYKKKNKELEDYKKKAIALESEVERLKGLLGVSKNHICNFLDCIFVLSP